MSEARRSRGNRWAIALIVAGVGVAMAIVWAVLVVVSLSNEVDDFPRSGIPGEVTLEVRQGETGTYYAYYERRELFSAVPVDVDAPVQVRDPGGTPIEVTERDGFLNYRLLDRVGQAHASFEATRTGTYTVNVEGPPPHDDATIAIGPSFAGSLVSDLAGPIVLLAVALLAGAAIALTGRH